MHERRKRWRIETILKLLKLLFPWVKTSWSVFKMLNKGLGGFKEDFKACEAAFSVHSMESFEKILANPHYHGS